MTVKYFGKGCEYFRGKWEEENSGQPHEEDYKDKNIPSLVYCNHPKNEDKYEGNCYWLTCPLGKFPVDFGMWDGKLTRKEIKEQRKEKNHGNDPGGRPEGI